MPQRYGSSGHAAMPQTATLVRPSRAPWPRDGLPVAAWLRGAPPKVMTPLFPEQMICAAISPLVHAPH
eukprot:8199205-Pyramimonas_sp.AAC.1